MKSTILRSFQSKSIDNENLVLFRYVNLLILINVNMPIYNNFLNNYLSIAVYEYSI